jgi:hypothetical protein
MQYLANKMGVVWFSLLSELSIGINMAPGWSVVGGYVMNGTQFYSRH